MRSGRRLAMLRERMFGMIERYTGVKMLDMSREHALGDQIAFGRSSA
jgi:hypothetical protein